MYIYKKFYIILDPQIKYINLTSQGTRHYERIEGKDIQWVVNIDAYPTPDVQW